MLHSLRVGSVFDLAGRPRFVQSHRSLALAQRIALHIESLVPQGRARCLDIGCGDMTLVEAIDAADAATRRARTGRCIDVHARRRCPSFATTRVGASTASSTAARFHMRDDEFDVALLCDVLHHAPEDAARLLAEAGRVARHVLVKDDFDRRLAHCCGSGRATFRSRARGSCGSRSSSGSSSRRSTPVSTRAPALRARARRRTCFVPTGSSSQCCARG